MLALFSDKERFGNNEYRTLRDNKYPAGNHVGMETFIINCEVGGISP